MCDPGEVSVSGVVVPYAVVNPYCTLLLAARLLVQEKVELPEDEVAEMLEKRKAGAE